MITYWNYRIVHHQELEVYSIHQAYYDKSGTIVYMQSGPSVCDGESTEELRHDVELQMRAFELPILTEKDVCEERDLAYGDWREFKRNNWRLNPPKKKRKR